MRIEKAGELGFCFGVRRAVDILEKAARERGGVETLGALVHNQQVLERLAKTGVRVAKGVNDIQGHAVVVSAHGITPQLEEEIQARNITIIDTTCPFVHRLQLATQRLADTGFFVVIYGDSDHPEVKAALGWANNQGVAALDAKKLENLPRRLGILSQTTRIPAHFTEFVKSVVDAAFTRDSELRVIDTICHDIRDRQAAALDLARRVELMLVIGDRSSANTNRLVELCSNVTKTFLVETAADIQPSWLQGHSHVGITAGTSTSEQTIEEVIARLEAMT
ncbi:4-hydroxy-3-methylbut-2-enyl diphosphate reductase [Chloroflexota bacterium]